MWDSGIFNDVKTRSWHKDSNIEQSNQKGLAMNILFQFFQALKETTQAFPFESVENEPAGASEDELRDYRLQTLIDKARKMGVRKYYEMPESFRPEFTREEWIQDALTIFFEQTRRYDRLKNPSFNRYIMTMVKKRLTDTQRQLFRKNPPVEEALRKIATSLERELKREPTAKELSEYASIDEEKAREFLESGVTKRIVETRDREELDQAEVRATVSPEKQYIRMEARKILWDCIRQMNQGVKLLFVRHEFGGVSFQKLFDVPKYRKILKSGSLRTFQRDYEKSAYKPVHDCVQKKYEITHLK